ncbi:hypothetical protein ACB098_07G043300 [Castanea mollissima]
MGGTNPNRPLTIAWVTTIYWRVILGMFKHYLLEHQSFVHIRILLSVRKSGERLLKILLQWEKISQGKNEHKSFLSSMISRCSYSELRKKKKLAVGGKQKCQEIWRAPTKNIVALGKKIAQGKNEYQAFFIHCSLEKVLNSEKEIQLWLK